ncbi:hypothetical protein BJX64DRAFT_272254 [Aspergillus heterothallicus]
MRHISHSRNQSLKVALQQSLVTQDLLRQESDNQFFPSWVAPFEARPTKLLNDTWIVLVVIAVQVPVEFVLLRIAHVHGDMRVIGGVRDVHTV